MATYDYVDSTDNQYYGGSATIGLPVQYGDKDFVVQRVVNIATAATALKSGTAFVAEDVLELIHIPADTLIKCVRMEITTASTDSGSPHIDIGDGDDLDGWIAAKTAAATAGTNVIDKTYTDFASVEQKSDNYYTTTDTIDMILGNAAMSDGVYSLWVYMVDMS